MCVFIEILFIDTFQVEGMGTINDAITATSSTTEPIRLLHRLKVKANLARQTCREPMQILRLRHLRLRTGVALVVILAAKVLSGNKSDFLNVLKLAEEVIILT